MANSGKSLWSPARVAKFALISYATGKALSIDGPPKALLGRVFVGCAACVAPGLFDLHLAYSFGYGAAMVYQAALWSRAAPGLAAPLTVMYTLYGLKVILFQAARELRGGYVAKFLTPYREKSPRGFDPKKLPAVLSTAVLLSCFSLPVHAATRAPRHLSVSIGGIVAAAGLLLQTIADAQKYLHKSRNGADSFVTTGLWRYSRHVNYLGEIYFHAGLIIAGVGGAVAAGSVPAAYLSLLSPVVFISIMLSATPRLAKRQLEAYGGDEAFLKYVEQTPLLFFELPSRRSEDESADLPSE